MKIIVGIILVVVSYSVAFAEFQFTMKDGNSFIWKSYNESGGNYCAQKYGGSFCVSKGDVASVKEIKDNTPEGATIIYAPARSNEERERAGNDLAQRNKTQECNELAKSVNESHSAAVRASAAGSLKAAMSANNINMQLREKYRAECASSSERAAMGEDDRRRASAAQQQRNDYYNNTQRQNQLNNIEEKLDRIDRKSRHGY